jgi:hypothetical protein
MGHEPWKQVGVLAGREVAPEDLIEVMMAVDQAGQQNMAGEVEHDIRRAGQGRGRTDLLDHAVAGKQTGVAQFAPLTVHRHDDGGILREQGSHLVKSSPPKLSKRATASCASAPCRPCSRAPSCRRICRRISSFETIQVFGFVLPDYNLRLFSRDLQAARSKT